MFGLGLLAAMMYGLVTIEDLLAKTPLDATNKQDFIAGLARVKTLMRSIALVGLLTLGVVSYLFWSGVMAPLKRLQNIIVDTTEKMDFTHALAVSSEDVIGGIITTFNGLMAKLCNSFSIIKGVIENLIGITEEVDTAARKIARNSHLQRDASVNRNSAIGNMVNGIANDTTQRENARQHTQESREVAEACTQDILITLRSIQVISESVELTASTGENIFHSVCEQETVSMEISKKIEQIAQMSEQNSQASSASVKSIGDILRAGCGIIHTLDSYKYESEDARINLRVADAHSVNNPAVRALLKMSEYLKERSKGRITLKVCAGGMLGNDVEVFEKLKIGASPYNWARKNSIMRKKWVLSTPAENNIPSFDSYKQHEVFKFYSHTEHARVPELIVFSEKRWQTLSPEDQASDSRSDKRFGPNHEKILARK